MIEQLEKNKGNKIVVELASRKQIAGTVTSVDQQGVRLETDEGICFIDISAIQIIWETINRSLAVENMKDIAYQLQAAEEAKTSSDALQSCVMGYSQPCYQPFHQSCTASYAQSCRMHFSGGCYQAYAQPCGEVYAQPCTGAYACAQSYGRPCRRPFTPTPYEDSCYGQYGFPYPYPPYPPYPYPYPYPYAEGTL
jgi:hypothetical protein